MTDVVADTRVEVPTICPTCTPDHAGPAVVTYCQTHAPSVVGADDVQVRAESFLSGSAEAGGEDNRAFCELVHRKARLLTGGTR